MRSWVLAAVLVATTGTARADELDPRVLVLPVEGDTLPKMTALSEEVAEALGRGAGTVTTTVARATTTVADTAVIVGCDPAEPECLDAVAAALNVDQLLIARITASGTEDATVEVVAVTREAEPVTRSFPIHSASKDADLLALEQATPAMLEAGEARRKEKEEQEKEKVPPPPDPPPPPPSEGKRSITPLFLAGGGVAIGIAGGVFWWLASGTQGEIDDAPTGTAEDLERLADLEGKARNQAMIGNVLVIAGGVAIAGGVTWYLLSPKKRESRVQAAPLVLPGGGGIGISGSW